MRKLRATNRLTNMASLRSYSSVVLNFIHCSTLVHSPSWTANRRDHQVILPKAIISNGPTCASGFRAFLIMVEKLRLQTFNDTENWQKIGLACTALTHLKHIITERARQAVPTHSSTSQHVKPTRSLQCKNTLSWSVLGCCRTDGGWHWWPHLKFNTF